MIHKRDVTAAIIALVECTAFSNDTLNIGAIPVKIIPAGARNAKNWNVEGIDNHAGNNRNAQVHIIIGKRNFK